jgi:L-ascorbate metabolism protein UlaG (beta-lactamase superfamily)
MEDCCILTLRYHGHDCREIDDGTHRVLIDQFLKGNPKPTAKPDSFTKLDAIPSRMGTEIRWTMRRRLQGRPVR